MFVAAEHSFLHLQVDVETVYHILEHVMYEGAVFEDKEGISPSAPRYVQKCHAMLRSHRIILLPLQSDCLLYEHHSIFCTRSTCSITQHVAHLLLNLCALQDWQRCLHCASIGLQESAIARAGL